MHCSSHRFIYCDLWLYGIKNRGNTCIMPCEENSNSIHQLSIQGLRLFTGFLPVLHTTLISGASSVLNVPCSCVCSWNSHVNDEDGRRRNSETMGSDAIVIHNIYSRVWDFRLQLPFLTFVYKEATNNKWYQSRTRSG